jgi:hypothetical protein
MLVSAVISVSVAKLRGRLARFLAHGLCGKVARLEKLYSFEKKVWLSVSGSNLLMYMQGE